MSWQDRETLSKTYGCFDRTYWSWKFTDFPGARFQEGVYTLAHLFSHSFEGNDFYKDDRILQWAVAGMRFWRKIQYGDGSFDEAYPAERSLAATAFTGFYIGEAFLLLRSHLDEGESAAVRASLARAGDWLCRNDERHGLLSNHLAAAAAALVIIHRVCDDARYERRARHFIQRIYDHQSDEGWYEEYGGADPGYQSHATFYLARVWHYWRDQQLLDSLCRSLDFLKFCVHPNGTIGGEYGSRNTEFYFPAGCEILAPGVPAARLVAQFMRQSLESRKTAGLSAMDTYNFLPMLNNYLFAAAAARNLGPADDDLPCQAEQVHRVFPRAGLVVKGTRTYYAIFGMSKGGVFKVYRRRPPRLEHSDCGYWGRLANGQVISSQSFQSVRPLGTEDDAISIDVAFAKVNQPIQSPWRFLAFRLYSLSFGRVRAAAYWIKDVLVYMLVRRRREVPLRLLRCVRFGAHDIVISDKLYRTAPIRLSELYKGDKFSAIHMGSSRYFQSQELEPAQSSMSDLSHELNTLGVYAAEQRLHFSPAASP